MKLGGWEAMRLGDAGKSNAFLLSGLPQRTAIYEVVDYGQRLQAFKPPGSSD
jgi:hypothetical protein